MVDQLREFFEWLLEGRFTAEQRKEFQRLMVEVWGKNDLAGNKGFIDLLRIQGRLVLIAPSDKKGARDKLQPQILEGLRKEKGDQTEQLLLSVYDTAHQQGGVGSQSADDSPEAVGGFRLDKQAIELYNKDQYNDAQPLFERAMTVREHLYGDNHPLVARSLYYLATIYRFRHDYARADLFLKRAEGIFEEAFGADYFFLSNV
jgi:hypothetical protein